jgi:spermidine/putrescine transport system substrate-binding protein
MEPAGHESPRDTAAELRVDRLRFLQLAGAGAAIPTLAGFLAACGDSSSEGGGTAGGFDGSKILYLGLEGEDGKSEATAFRKRHDLRLQSTYVASANDIFAKLKAGQVYDLALLPNPYVQRMIEADLIQPLDLSQIPNQQDLYPNLRKPEWGSKGGDLYVIPIAWGDGPFVYNPKNVTTVPKSAGDILGPSWNKRYVLFDDPAVPFMLFGRLLGFDPPHLTFDQLDQVSAKASQLVKGAVAFANGYEDATDLIARGEADLSFSGAEFMLNLGKEKGLTLDYAFFEESHGGGFADGLAVPKSAKNLAGAHAYINEISPKVNAAISTTLSTAVTNEKARPLLAPDLAKLYSYEAVESPDSDLKFEDWVAPSNPPEGIASQADWLEAWQKVKAG